MKARLSNSNVSPKKMNLVAGMIRKKTITQATNTLKFADKKAAGILLKLLNSAVANATNNFQQDKETLVVDEIKVGKGMTLKRFNAVSRGRAHKIRKVKSNILLTLKKIVVESEVAKPAPKEKATESTSAKKKTSNSKTVTTK